MSKMAEPGWHMKKISLNLLHDPGGGNRTQSWPLSLVFLVVWSFLCAAWNFYGVTQLAKGLSALGPTATYVGGGLALVLGVALVAASRSWPGVYKLLAAMAGVLAAITIVGSFTKDAALWPSDFWRFAGVAVNAIGLVGAVLAVSTGWARDAAS